MYSKSGQCIINNYQMMFHPKSERKVLKTMQRVLKAAGYLSRRVYTALKDIDESFLPSVSEIRLRAEKPLSFITFDGIFYLNTSGRITAIPTPELFCVTQNDIKESFSRICEYSVYSYAKDIQSGFITVGDGNRAGIYGTAVYERDRLNTVRSISGINLRIARQVKGCADELMKLTQGGGLNSVLICGAPSTGKTTILRDFARQVSDTMMKKVAVVDERGEIAAVSKGIAGNDVGINTDILDGYIKYDGIMQAVRTLSPDVIVCDEIGSSDDCKAVSAGINSGVKFAAAVHAGSEEELFLKKNIVELILQGAFRKLVFLKSGSPCVIEKICDAEVFQK